MSDQPTQFESKRSSSPEGRRGSSRALREREEEPLGAGCAVRLLWLVAGPVAVAFTAAMLARHETSDLLTVAAVFWGVVIAMVVLRYWDVTRLGGQTSNGEPATLAHFKRYSITVSLAAAALFCLALLVRG